MLSFFFHRCGMRHEEFSFSSNSADDFSPWKRNPLCSVETRSKNIFCTHGTAILNILKEPALTNPELRNQLSVLQNRLFSIDHKKGELEKYVFEEEKKKRSQMLEKMKDLMQDYDTTCQQIQNLLAELFQFESNETPFSGNHNSISNQF